jgi:hypothetical protein
MKKALTDQELANVRSVRQRYYAAIAEGFSQDKASKIANGTYAVTDEDRARRGRANRPDLAAIGTPQRVGGPSPENLKSEFNDSIEIPDNYSELPWNQLRSLAKKIQDLPIRDKGDAVGIIDASMRRRASSQPMGEGQVDQLIGFRSAPELEAEAKVAHDALQAGATDTGEPGKLPDGANPDPSTGTVAGQTNVDFANDGLKPKEIGTKAANKKLQPDPAAAAAKRSKGKKVAADLEAKKIAAADSKRKLPKDATGARAEKAADAGASTLPKRKNPPKAKTSGTDGAAGKTGERIEGLDK